MAFTENDLSALSNLFSTFKDNLVDALEEKPETTIVDKLENQLAKKLEATIDEKLETAFNVSFVGYMGIFCFCALFYKTKNARNQIRFPALSRVGLFY